MLSHYAPVTPSHPHCTRLGASQGFFQGCQLQPQVDDTWADVRCASVQEFAPPTTEPEAVVAMKEKLRTRVKEQAEQEVTRKKELEAQAKARCLSLRAPGLYHRVIMTVACAGVNMLWSWRRKLHAVDAQANRPSEGSSCDCLLLSHV